jgi:uncharacterized protein (TIGR04255 family)
MTDRSKFRPFTGDSDRSVRLTRAPLKLVLCQVRWPALNNLQTEEQLRAIAPRFGERMTDYPLFSEAKNINYVITPEGITQSDAGSVYQWVSVDDAWHVSLARQFMTLYCTRYPADGYMSLDARLRTILEVLQATLRVPLIDRVGVRYVNRLSSQEDMRNLRALVLPEVLGYQALDQVPAEPALLGSTNQATYQVGDALLQVRSGVFPANQTVDQAIRPLPDASWVLDLDASREARQLLDVDEVTLTASRMSDIAYDYFKFIATPAFIERFSDGSPDDRRS